MTNKFIAVTIGDIDGVGIELLIDLFIKKKLRNFILFSNSKIIKKYINDKKIKIKIKIINNEKINFSVNKKNSFFYLYDFKEINKIKNTYHSLKYAYEYTKKNNLKGIVTLPLNKYKIIKNVDKKFIGQTEFFQKLDKQKISNMIFIKDKIIVTTLTTHIKIDDITKTISDKNYIFNKIKSLNNILIEKLNIKKPKLIISGVNPHAGENGAISDQDNKYISSAVNKLKKVKINIEGPISADSMMIKQNIDKYSCFIFIFHDQALIPFKLISNYTGVNFTGGLKVIRVSPDHGTAYDLVGKNKATNTSLLNCFKLLNKNIN